MNGRDFLDCAIPLGQSDSAYDLRSAVSRAYYAAFHVALEFFRACGVTFPKGSSQAHTKIPDCLDNLNITHVAVIASELRSLRSDRNVADYTMNDAKFERQSNAQLRIKSAQDVIRKIDDLRPDQENIRRLLRPEAKKLGLNVV